ncbi:MAG: serine/threonine protein kinase [Polyangiales bacterium]
MQSIAPGEVFLDKYEIVEVIGKGGMGVVVSARHIDLDEMVAIKFLHPEYAEQHDQVERFLREGRAAAKIKSDHVARVRDVGTQENGAPYMIMEHLVGTDLGALLEKEGPLPVEEAAEFVLQACDCLAEAHAAGIVHRDLKPANLFLTELADGTPRIKVLDFGISKLIDTRAATLTKTNGLVGSPLYMAPEQLSSPKTVDSRADVWALGVILFQLVSGKRPFETNNIAQLILMVASEEPTPLSSLVPNLPAGFADVIMRCLVKNPDDRIPDVGALATALEPFAPAESKKTIERIVRVVSGIPNPTSRRRGGRTVPQPIDTTPANATRPSRPSAEPGTPAPSAPLSKTEPEGGAKPKNKLSPLVIAIAVVVLLAIVFLAMRR